MNNYENRYENDMYQLIFRSPDDMRKFYQLVDNFIRHHPNRYTPKDSKRVGKKIIVTRLMGPDLDTILQKTDIKPRKEPIS